MELFLISYYYNGIKVKIGSNLGSDITIGTFPNNSRIIGQFYPIEKFIEIKGADLKILYELFLPLLVCFFRRCCVF